MWIKMYAQSHFKHQSKSRKIMARDNILISMALLSLYVLDKTRYLSSALLLHKRPRALFSALIQSPWKLIFLRFHSRRVTRVPARLAKVCFAFMEHMFQISVYQIKQSLLVSFCCHVWRATIKHNARQAVGKHGLVLVCVPFKRIIISPAPLP